jgi:Tol biopolymer transport system component
MRVANGTRLGPYEIVEQLGAGGMGEVWKARDTRLDRSVAVKILPAEFAANAQLRSRFEREARTISQLSHPNICTLFDVGETSSEHDDDPMSYLVMELLDGETLADRVARGALSIRETLQIGAQIADALDRAHRAGIVHRDLKPGNIMLTKSGAKLLDFGLAKTAAPSSAPFDATEHRPLTQEGTILGTFQYMAPEQLEGLEADARTDIFALGAVLYEMATGKRAFSGSSKTSLIASIVSAEPPPISSVQPLTPPAFEHVVRKCLAKDREARWQSAYDVAEELRWISEAGSSAGVASPVARRRMNLQWAGWIVAAIVAAAAIGYWRFAPKPVPPRVVTAVAPPDNVAVSYIDGSIALSPDGRALAFVGREKGGKPMLFVRPLDRSAAHAIAGTEDASFPFWSPDAKYLAFSAAGKLKKVGLEGGAPETLGELLFRGGTWAPSGDIIYSTGQSISKLAASGAAKPVTIIEQSARSVSAPSLLPDGRHFLFTVYRGSQNSSAEGVFVASLDGKDERLIVPNVYSNASYASGYIVYSREGDLRAQRFDPRTLKVSGDQIRLADHVQYDADAKAALYSVSSTGMLLYVEGEGAGKSQLAWVTRDGKDAGVLGPPAMYYTPRLSHDGKRIAFDLSDSETAKGDLWTYDIARAVMSRITYDAVNESAPNWAPDDMSLVFFSEKQGSLDLYRRAPSSTGSDELLAADNDLKVPMDISPDGRWLAFNRRKRDSVTNGDIWLYDLVNRKAAPYLTTPFNEDGLSFSPDGSAVAFVNNESGKHEVYVQQFPDAGVKIVVSRNGGRMPAWRADGKELYYLSEDWMIVAVPMTLGPQLDSGTPVPLFESRLRFFNSQQAQYAVTADGTKFLLNRMVGLEGTRPMTLVQNWAASLPR